MSVHKLLDPILDQGLLHTNFFEGRLLSAQDLRDQQDANRERGRRLGRALGSGIVDGLEVVLESDGADGQPPVVTVKAGLAINAEGEIIGLPKHDVQVALARSIAATPTTEADFYACAGPPTTKHLPNGVGVYVLVMSPAAGYKDRAPMSGLGDAGVVKGCGSRYVSEGVRFRLIEPPIVDAVEQPDVAADALLRELLTGPEPPTRDNPQRLSLLRNLIAHRLFASEDLRAAFADLLNAPFGFQAASGGAVLAGRTVPAGLDDCDVPLALLYWTFAGVQFLDLWAVRRTLQARAIQGGGPYGLCLPPAAADARLRQFHAQLHELVDAQITPANVKVREHFRWLPPLGVVPIVGNGVTDGVDIDRFFDGLTVSTPIYVEGGEVARMLADSLFGPVVDAAGAELVWRYVVRENIQASSTTGPGRAAPVALFASPALPLYGESRYNAKYWNFGNYR